MKQGMRIHPDVLAAHAQFGGDLETMQKAYEHPDLVAEVARLRAAIADARNEALESAAKVADDALVSGVHAVFKNGHFSHDELHSPAEMRARVAAAIRAMKGTT
jgi:hypothetical protein